MKKTVWVLTVYDSSGFGNRLVVGVFRTKKKGLLLKRQEEKFDKKYNMDYKYDYDLSQYTLDKAVFE